jgi:hypothetical protein
MYLASFDLHEDIVVDLLGARIVFWALDLLRHGGVVMKVVVDGRVTSFLPLRPVYIHSRSSILEHI